MREHGALRPARRAARIEEPGQIIRRLGFDGNGLPGLNRPIFGGVDLHHAFKSLDFINERRYRPHEVGGGEATARARIFEDEGHFFRMEFRVDGQSAAPCMPYGVENLQKRRAVLHGDGGAVPGLHLKIFPQVARHGAGPPGELLIRAMNRFSKRNGRPLSTGSGRPGQEFRHVHSKPPSRKSRPAIHASTLTHGRFIVGRPSPHGLMISHIRIHEYAIVLNHISTMVCWPERDARHGEVACA